LSMISTLSWVRKMNQARVRNRNQARFGDEQTPQNSWVWSRHCPE
jgi:hypothetical protein